MTGQQSEQGSETNEPQAGGVTYNLHFHINNLQPEAVEKIAHLLALDLQQGQQQVALIQDQIQSWAQTAGEPEKPGDPIQQMIHERVTSLKQELHAKQDYVNSIKKEVMDLSQPPVADTYAGMSQPEHIQKRLLVRATIERLLDQKIEEIVSRDKMDQMTIHQGAEADLLRLKKELGEQNKS